MDRKGNMAILTAFIVGLGTAGIYLMLFADINEDVGSEFEDNTVANNVSDDVGASFSNVSTRLPLLGTVIGVVLLLIYVGYIRTQ